MSTEFFVPQWPTLTFGDVLSEPLRNGIYKPKEFHGRGQKVVNMGELFGNDFISNQEMKRVELTEREKVTSLLTDGDLLFARRSLVLAGSGKCSIVTAPPEETTFESSIIRARLDRKKTNPLYFYYFFKSPFGRGLMASIATQTAVSGITGSDLSQLQVPLPPLPTQNAVAAFLRTYDDLIENNTRRINILEQMAQMLYQERFVDFRFPGHEKVRMVESECGRKPDGWTVRPLGDVATITMGLSPKGDTYNEDGDGLPLINGPVEFDERFPRAVKWTTRPTKLCKEGDLIVCVRGSTTGRHVKSDAVYCLGRGVCALSSNYQCFIDLLFHDQLPALLAKTSGSTFPSWTGPLLKSHLVLCPPVEELAVFETMVQPLNAAILVYSRQTRNLRVTRDLLLPKLVSGEVSVEQIESEAIARNV